MSWRPALNVVCGRCGHPRGLAHVCVSNSRRKPTLKPNLSFGTCPKCRKPYEGNPLGHTCAPRSDFRKRKAAFEKRQRDEARSKRQRQAHDYTECSDDGCKRAVCVAYKTGRDTGEDEGYARGWELGYAQGVASCPRPHQ
jgi:hypothetical protein